MRLGNKHLKCEFYPLSISGSPSPYLCHSKVCNFDNIVCSEEEVAWLDIFVHDAPPMEVLQPIYQLNKVTERREGGRGGRRRGRGGRKKGRKRREVLCCSKVLASWVKTSVKCAPVQNVKGARF